MRRLKTEKLELTTGGPAYFVPHLRNFEGRGMVRPTEV